MTECPAAVRGSARRARTVIALNRVAALFVDIYWVLNTDSRWWLEGKELRLTVACSTKQHH